VFHFAAHEIAICPVSSKESKVFAGVFKRLQASIPQFRAGSLKINSYSAPLHWAGAGVFPVSPQTELNERARE
jgi:hypothetical protein